MVDAQHIGIVACSAEGAALCYLTIVGEGPAMMGRHAHPEITMHTPSLAAYAACIDRDDWDGVGELMLASTRKLAASGAQFVICPDNTIHRAFAYVQQRTPLPWLHIAEVVAADAAKRGFRRLGLLGTTWLVESDVYPAVLAATDIAYVRPSAEDRAEVGRIIIEELIAGRFTEASVRYLHAVIERLRDAGCDAVVLGCTELPLVITPDDAALPTLDSTRLLARAALARALATPLR